MQPTDARAGAFGAASAAARRIDRATSVLLVVDIQARLVPHIADRDGLIARTKALLIAAKRLDVPRIATEHCPGQIGPLVDDVKALVDDGRVFGKTRFGATDHADFRALLARIARPQVVVAGMEAHVCVMQTALGIVGLGYEVFVAGDAVGSRGVRQTDRDLALTRLQASGCTIAGTETILFEWTGGGDDAAFRDILELVKALPAPQNFAR